MPFSIKVAQEKIEFGPDFVIRRTEINLDPPPLKWSTLMYVTGIEED